MANSNGWGDGAANNTIGLGQGKVNNAIGWGSVYSSSNAGRTDIIGTTGTAPFVVTAPTLSDSTVCATPGNYVTIQSMVLGGNPTPTLTYNWQGVIGESSVIDFNQYTNTLYVDYSFIGFNYWCIITATNSAGVLIIQTPEGFAQDCS
jgi:hypothetical protein